MAAPEETDESIQGPLLKVVLHLRSALKELMTKDAALEERLDRIEMGMVEVDILDNARGDSELLDECIGGSARELWAKLEGGRAAHLGAVQSLLAREAEVRSTQFSELQTLLEEQHEAAQSSLERKLAERHALMQEYLGQVDDLVKKAGTKGQAETSLKDAEEQVDAPSVATLANRCSILEAKLEERDTIQADLFELREISGMERQSCQNCLQTMKELIDNETEIRRKSSLWQDPQAELRQISELVIAEEQGIQELLSKETQERELQIGAIQAQVDEVKSRLTEGQERSERHHSAIRASVEAQVHDHCALLQKRVDQVQEHMVTLERRWERDLTRETEARRAEISELRMIIPGKCGPCEEQPVAVQEILLQVQQQLAGESAAREQQCLALQRSQAALGADLAGERAQYERQAAAVQEHLSRLEKRVEQGVMGEASSRRTESSHATQPVHSREVLRVGPQQSSLKELLSKEKTALEEHLSSVQELLLQERSVQEFSPLTSCGHSASQDLGNGTNACQDQSGVMTGVQDRLGELEQMINRLLKKIMAQPDGCAVELPLGEMDLSVEDAPAGRRAAPASVHADLLTALVARYTELERRVWREAEARAPGMEANVGRCLAGQLAALREFVAGLEGGQDKDTHTSKLAEEKRACEVHDHKDKATLSIDRDEHVKEQKDAEEHREGRECPDAADGFASAVISHASSPHLGSASQPSGRVRSPRLSLAHRSVAAATPRLSLAQRSLSTPGSPGVDAALPAGCQPMSPRKMPSPEAQPAASSFPPKAVVVTVQPPVQAPSQGVPVCSGLGSPQVPLPMVMRPVNIQISKTNMVNSPLKRAPSPPRAPMQLWYPGPQQPQSVAGPF